MNILLLVFMSKIKNDLTLKKSNFLSFFYVLKLQKLSLFQCVNHRNRDTASFLVALQQI